MSAVELSKAQMTNLREAVKRYESWLKRHEASQKEGQELFKKVQTCVSSQAGNWGLLSAEVDQVFARAFKELDV
jgi:cytochrome c2